MKLHSFGKRLQAGCFVVAALLVLFASVPARAAGPAHPAAYTEPDLIAVLKSKTPPAEKALACKRLAVFGTEKAVPVIAPLLADKDLTSWARIALEAIPGPAADKALRQAAGKLHGRMLVGILNSLGVRRDPKAVKVLARRLKDTDAEVASAAADALGRVGGLDSAKVLARFLPQSPPDVRSAAAEGCIRCAERLLAQANTGEALKLYELVRATDVPQQRLLEAIRGCILARGSDGLPLLLAQLRSTDKALLAIGLSTARELPGRDITQALAEELRRSSPERQPLLLLALADRHDPAALPTILDSAKSGPGKVRLTAVGILDRSGDAAGLPVLLDCAADPDAALAAAAKTAVGRLPGNQIDNDLLARLRSAAGKPRQVLLELAGRRGIVGAVPLALAAAGDGEPASRGAALQALGLLANAGQLPELVKLLQSAAPDGRSDVEKALLAISSRAGADSVPHLVPLASSGDAALRMVALHALASAGGPNALAALKTATQDQDETVQDEAVRTLSSWPNTWPEDAAVAEPLLAIAKSGSKSNQKVLAVRGYLQFLQGDKKLKDEDKVAKVKDALPLLERPEDKRLAISVIGEIPAPGALDLLQTFADEPALAEDACSALVTATAKDKPAFSKDQRRKALQTAVDKCTDDATKKKAKAALAKIK